MFKGYSKSISFNYEYRPPKWVAFLISLAIFIIPFFIYTFTSISPSHDRDWELGFERLPSISVDSNLVTIKNLRDFHYQKGAIPLDIAYILPGYSDELKLRKDVIYKQFAYANLGSGISVSAICFCRYHEVLVLSLGITSPD